MSFFVSFTAFVLRSILSDMSIATPAFFWSLFAWNIFLQPFTFNRMCLLFRGGSFVDNIYRGLVFVFIQPVCLLVGAFNPFTFKVIIDKYDPIAIYFVVLGFEFINLFCLSCLEKIL